MCVTLLINDIGVAGNSGILEKSSSSPQNDTNPPDLVPSYGNTRLKSNNFLGGEPQIYWLYTSRHQIKMQPFGMQIPVFGLYFLLSCFLPLIMLNYPYYAQFTPVNALLCSIYPIMRHHCVQVTPIMLNFSILLPMHFSWTHSH